MPVKASDNLMQNFAQFGRITNCANIKNYCYMKRMVCDILVDLFDMLNGFDTCSKSGAAGKSKKQTELLLENYVNDPAVYPCRYRQKNCTIPSGTWQE